MRRDGNHATVRQLLLRGVNDQGQFAEHDQVLDETVRDFDARASLTNGGECVKGLKDRPAEEPDQKKRGTVLIYFLETEYVRCEF